MATLDTLELNIQADANKAVKAIDTLEGKLTQLGHTLESVQNKNYSDFADGIKRFSEALNSVPEIKASTVSNIAKLPDILIKLSDASKKVDGALFSQIGSGLTDISAGMSALKSVRVQSFTKIADGINQLSTISPEIGKISHSMLLLGNALSLISGSGDNMSHVALTIKEFTKSVKYLGNANLTDMIPSLREFTKATKEMVLELSDLPQVSENTIQTISAMSGLISAQTDRAREAEKASRSLKNQNVRTSKSIFSIAKSMGLFYASFGYIKQWANNLWKIVGSSMDYLETYNYFNVITDKIEKEFSKAGESSADEFQKSFRERMTEVTSLMTGYTVGNNGELLNTGKIGLGVDANQLLEFQSKIAGITNSVGLLGEQSVIASNSLTKLAVDLSSLTNQDVADVMNNITSAMVGQARAMYKYGVDITDAKLEEIALANGISKATSEMKQSEKMQLRLLAILEQTKVAWGDQARTIDSVANQFRIFTQQSSNLGRTFGNVLLPIVKNVLPYLNGAVIALNNLTTSIGSAVWGKSWLTDLQDNTTGEYLVKGFEELTDSADEAEVSLENLKGSVRGFDELNIISTSKTGLDGLTDQIDLTDALNKKMAEYDAVWNKAFEDMQNKAENIAEVFSKKLNISTIAKDIKTLTTNLKNFSDSMKPFVEGFGAGFSDFMKRAGGFLYDTINTGIEGLAKAFNMVPDDVIKVVGESLGIVAGAFVTMSTITKFSSIVSALQGLFSAKISNVAGLTTFGKVLGATALAFEAISFAYDKIGEAQTKDFIKSLGLGEVEKEITDTEDSLSNLYKEWKRLTDKDNPTDIEKQKIKELSDLMKEKSGVLSDYINAEGFAYENVRKNLEKVIALEDERIKKAALAEKKQELIKASVSNDIALGTNQATINKIIEEIRKYTGNVSTTDEIVEALKKYYAGDFKSLIPGGEIMKIYDFLYDAYVNRTGNTGAYFSEFFNGAKGGSAINKLLGIDELKEYFDTLTNNELIDKQLKYIEALEKVTPEFEKQAEEFKKSFGSYKFNYSIPYSGQTVIPQSYSNVGNTNNNAGYSFNSSQPAQLVSPSVQVNVTLSGDAEQLFKVVQKEANNYSLRTGDYAFGMG